jgi:hypothetical protein
MTSALTRDVHPDTLSHLVSHFVDVSPDNFTNKDSLVEICARAREFDGDAEVFTAYVVGRLMGAYGVPRCSSNEMIGFYASMSIGQLSEYLPLVQTRSPSA